MNDKRSRVEVLKAACVTDEAFSKRTDPKIALAQAVGLRHQQCGQPCQDAIFSRVDCGVTCIALADGAGSAEHAEIGAVVALDILTRVVTRRFRRLAAYRSDLASSILVRSIVRGLRAAAKRLDGRVEQLACTLLFAAHDGTSLLVGQLGDGQIGLRMALHGQWIPARLDWRGEYANETVFVTSANACARLQIRTLEAASVTGVILMSDGAESSLFSRQRQTFATAVETMATWVREGPRSEVEIAMKKNLVEILRRRTMDDLSVAIMTDGRC
jgi:hypothetical protein